jgi:rifampicin phosphotransferase
VERGAKEDVVNTEILPRTIPVAVDVPPGYWRREASHCPQPLSPLFRVAAPVVTECFRRMFSEMGVMPETLEFREIGGWVYTRVVPPGGEEGKPPSPELIRERVERSTEAIRSDRFGKYLDQWPQWRSDFVAGIAELRSVDLGVLDDQGLADHHAEVMQFALGAFDVHFLLHGINAITLADLAFTCRDLLGWDDVRTLELLSGLSEATTEPATALARLTTMARERPEVRRFIEGGVEDDARLWEIDPEFAAAFSAYQGEFGFRTIRYEVIEPSMQETPSFTLGLIADQLRSDFDLAARATEVTREREAVRAEARALLAGRPEADRARFERVLDRAERWYPIREDNAPMTMSEPFALIRRVALEIGRRLAESSVIDDPDDVFFLETEEAGAALAARGAGADCRDLVRRRQAERAWVLAHPGPPSYGAESGPSPVLDDAPAETRFVNEALVWLIERSGHFVKTHPQEAGRTLTGVAASGGTYTGPVRVLWSEADFDKLQPGDVLVCPITSPAWSVLFPKVGALVTDAGGLLSHPSIIAREFHIPAVVGTGNATALLSDGQQVTVDGTAGSIDVLA